MAVVTPTRYRWGAIAWLLTLQFFVVETVVQLQTGAHSRAEDVISELGTSASAAPLLMNASFVVQGLLIGAGAALLRPALAGLGGRTAAASLTAAAVGVVLVGFFPLDGQEDLHQAGAGLHLLGGGLALLALAYAVRPRSEALGTALALLGLLSTAMTVFFALGITSFLGEGGTERASAYPVPIGLALAGAGLWALGRRPQAEPRPSRRELRAGERAGRAERARERDAALEAAVGLPDPARPQRAPSDAEPDDDFDPEDPWAASRRRT
ncbi:DUF998 domain-containing protein [Geodermatophilus poikilotrophus]|uniref:Hypothetical membrane protein n=1 Tax=Geodermatophilus poikilotrophus TaxID=1333667 RepID=A0A1I0AXW4_9ACTN|nr:DUF998 domain-containing protein [Geodermatophilus poikilotrophus]SES98467.1 hypothetical membrane protein [Geodermatophilus poikilotrophus]